MPNNATQTTGKQTTQRSEAKPKLQRDVIALLTDDHREVEELFERFESAGSTDAKAQLLREIAVALTVHAQVEEELFYPAVRHALPEGRRLLDEARIEHAQVKKLMVDLSTTTVDDGLFDAKVRVLSEYVKHHVEEEEFELFPKVERSELDLDEIGAMAAERKQQLRDAFAPLEIPHGRH